MCEIEGSAPTQRTSLRERIRAIDLGKSFGVEQFVIAYKAGTVKQSVMSDLLEWLTR